MRVPIIGKKDSDLSEFKAEKLRIKELGYPADEVTKLVNAHIEPLFKKINDIPQNAILITPPSGSSKNKIPEFICSTLNYLRPDLGYLTDTDLSFKLLTTTEAKTCMTLDKRNSNPFKYDIDQNHLEELKEIVGNRKLVIVDDVIGSGETSVKFQKLLQSLGLEVAALFNLKSASIIYCSERDVERLSEKIHRVIPKVPLDAITNEVKTVFWDYTNQKLNRLERRLNSDNSIIKAWDTIKNEAKMEREFNQCISLSIIDNRNLSF